MWGRDVAASRPAQPGLIRRRYLHVSFASGVREKRNAGEDRGSRPRAVNRLRRGIARRARRLSNEGRRVLERSGNVLALAHNLSPRGALPRGCQRAPLPEGGGAFNWMGSLREEKFRRCLSPESGFPTWSGVPALADPAEGFGALEDGGDAAEVGGDGAGVVLDVADAVDVELGAGELY